MTRMSSLVHRLREALLPVGDYLESLDPSLVEQVAPVVKRGLGVYFRAHIEGLDHVPAGPAMIVGNHNAGITFLEPFAFAAEYYAQRGVDEPLRFLAHDAIAWMPALGPLLSRLGIVRATLETAREVLARGQKLVVFPGGNHEAFRPFRERNRIEFAGHKGFAALALESNVPLVPMLSLGGHNTFLVLTRGERLAHLLRADRLLRSDAWPISLALPWGVAVGPVFHLPLPARFRVVLAPAIDPRAAVADVPPERRVDALYERVVATLQAMMDEAVARPR